MNKMTVGTIKRLINQCDVVKAYVCVNKSKALIVRVSKRQARNMLQFSNPNNRVYAEYHNLSANKKVLFLGGIPDQIQKERKMDASKWDEIPF